MAEARLAVASAVIVPEESTERPPTPPTTLKRRQSSFSDDRAKRPLLNHDASNGNGNSRRDSVASPPETPIDRQAERGRSGQMEERKRGQRLFGALLGTLSQSSSSTAQKRRTDIEKKQQAKLKMQAEEQDEEKRMKREAIDTVRKGVQRKFDRQSMQIRHSNMLAQARCLHTMAEPKLYYKPWELLPSEEDRIEDQVKEAEATTEEENEQWDAENPPTEQQVLPDAKTEPQETKKETNGDVETVGSSTYEGKPPSLNAPETTNMNGTDSPSTQRKSTEPPEASKDQVDDGGEVVEGEEDTVIY